MEQVKPLFFCILLGISPWVQAQQTDLPELTVAEQETNWTPPPPKTHMESRDLRLEVVQGTDDNLEALPLGAKKGWVHVSLPTRENLGLRITNTSEGRLLLVVSINGLDPFTGHRAYQGQPGKVIEPGQSVVMRRGKFHKKAEFQPILPANQEEGNVGVAIFRERTDYPLVLPNMEPPPFGPENYRVGNDGVRRWVPPPRYPFRKVGPEPSELLFLQYSLVPTVSTQNVIASGSE